MGREMDRRSGLPVWAALMGVLTGVAACSDPPLVSASQVVGDAIPASLTGTPGTIEAGRAVFVGRDSGHCVLCHAIDGLEAEFQGNVGPDLTTVGRRFDAGQIRLRIVNIEAVAPGAIMPAYYRTQGLHQVAPDYKGRPVLTAEDIEHLVAFLAAQKGERHAG